MSVLIAFSAFGLFNVITPAVPFSLTRTLSFSDNVVMCLKVELEAI